MEQQIIWTALPNGISEENNLKLSVLVSPRLMSSGTDSTLAQFPDFLDWPQTNISFNVLFENGPSVPAKVTDKPCSQCWKALFKGSTYVRSYTFDDYLSPPEVISYPAQKLISQIKDVYTYHAEKFSTNFPGIENLKRWGNLEEELNDIKNFHEYPSTPFSTDNDFEKLDFHQMISMIGDFPYLMRKLGLIFDLEIPSDGIPLESSIQIKPSWNDSKISGSIQNRKDICPKTHYVFKQNSQFSAAQKDPNSKIENGLLKLDDTKTFAVTQIDLDGIGIKLLEFLRNVSNLNLLSTDTPSSYALPNIRSSGLSLVQSNRSNQLLESIENSKKLNDKIDSNNVELYAEDLIRGYRIDVLDSTNKWYSLCKRDGKYQFSDAGFTLSNKDEGLISLGATSINTTSLRLHESLVTWGGWSLVVPPIKSNNKVSNIEEIVETELKLKTTFTVPPKSLPKLRFGEYYQLRARIVDLAGNGRRLEENPNDCSGLTPSVKYRRFEPISSPVVDVYDVIPMTSGESHERMVIRSGSYKPVDSCKRKITKPLVSKNFAEVLGNFDGPEGSLDKKAYKLIVSEGKYSLHHDPLARGVAISGLPTPFSQEVIKIPFREFPLTLSITEGSNKVYWDETRYVFTICIPKAEILKIKISSYLHQKDLELMGLWGWLEEKNLLPNSLNTICKNALDGKMWMITPFREITLVHAVQQPLITPQFQKLTAKKDLNTAFVTLKDTFMIDGKSTSKLEVVAEWKEPKIKNISNHSLGENTINDNEMNEYKSCAIEAITIDEKQTWITLNHQHYFPDTKHRVVKYKAIATSRFSEYFYEPKIEGITLKGTNNLKLHAYQLIYGTEKVYKGKTVEESVQYVRDTDYEIDYIRGKIKRTICSRIGENEELIIEYKHLPVKTNCESQEISINILNSSRPVAPRINSIIPTFEWADWEEQQPNKIRGVSRKAGLRVYLDQPLISSGEGELLGVVLQSCNKTQTLDKLEPYVTQWGKDNIRKSNHFPSLPRLENFKNSKETNIGLSLPGLGDETVNVAGHIVEYNKERQLWYCDLEIEDGNSYFSFVSLALVSYQPNSVPDAHLSQVVSAGIGQLMPNRVASVMNNPSDPRLINVSVYGPGSELEGDETTPSRKNDIEVSLEKEHVNNHWIPVLGSTSLLTLTELDTPISTWMGQVVLPDIPSNLNKYRIVIKEFEWYFIDGDPKDSTNSSYLSRRLVYAKHLEV